MSSDNSTAILRLDQVSKAFGGVVTAEDVNFSVHSGHITGLIGPNGAGKSTMLNLISGIYNVDKGSIYFEGKNVTQEPSYKRSRMGIARTFQSPRFMHRSSIRDNMLIGIDLGQQHSYWQSFYGKKGRDLEEEIKEYLEIAELSIDWDEDIMSLPYGHKKMLEIVRALLSNPKIMLVDEPAAGLNDGEIARSIKLLEYATKKKNIGVVLIEHKMEMVMNICRDIVVLNFGRVIANDIPQKVATCPAVIQAYLGGIKHA